MNTAVNNKMVNSYFRYMRNWDTDTKKDIIIRLTSSIDSMNNNKYDFSSCFGAWEDSRNADEVIRELRTDRVNNREIEEF